MSKGTRYNKSKLRWRNFPLYLLRPVVEVADAAEKREGNPTGKYETLNFLKGLSVTETLESMMRHADDLLDPTQPDLDPEDGKHHLAKIAWNALVALHYIGTEWDDREMKHNPKFTEKDVDDFIEENSELLSEISDMTEEEEYAWRFKQIFGEYE